MGASGEYQTNEAVKTPLQQLIARLQEAWESNPGSPEYREGLAEALGFARSALPIEKSHICEAFREGAEGVKHQTGQAYYRDIYGGR